MYARHPAQVDSMGRKFVPAVHRAGGDGPSIFMYPGNPKYDNKLLDDGDTIHFKASSNAAVTQQLDALVGQTVTLYVQTARTEAREGRVTVSSAAGADGYHLKLVPPPGPRWADME
jgi:hypothetical protein